MTAHRTLFLIVLVLAGLHAGAQDCVLKKQGDQIQVFSCPSTLSKIKSIKATFTIDASLSRVVGFIMDADNYRDWQFNTVASRVLERRNEHELVYFAEIKAPLTISDRDMVSVISASQDPSTKVVTIRASIVPGYVAVREDFVRVPVSDATWIITPKGGRSEVLYYLLIDPGGSVPAWMINLVSTQGPYDSFYHLKRKIHEPKYANTKAAYIAD